VRFNTFISMALIDGLNPALLPHLGVASAIFIVVLNIVCVAVLTAKQTDRIAGRIVREIARNPLVLACLIGGLGRLIEVPDQFPITGISVVGQAALPVGVLCLGAGLQWHAIRVGIGLATLSTILQLFVKPFLFIALAYWFNLSAGWTLAALLLMCVSTAPSSFILARQLGGDAPLMAGIVAIQTVLAIATVPIVLWLAQFMNWIHLS
jgi:hypothetical protein